MIRYFMMKRNEWKVKAMFYATIASIMDEKKDVIGLVQKLYVDLKDVPVDELRKEFIHSLAEIIHEQNSTTDDSE